MKEIIYDKDGLSIWRNERNKFVVARLHYSADPAKRTPEWYAEARSGMTEGGWRREYEIDFTAQEGERVFPEFIDARSRIVVSEPYPDFPHSTYYGGLDYGSRNPSSVHFYTIYDGVIYCVWELYKPCRDIKEFVSEVKSFPYFNNVKYIACDPSIFSKTTRNAKGLPASIYELFVGAGLTKLVRGNNDEASWVAQMRLHWSNPDDPTFRIFSCCPNIIREFESAVYTNMSDKARVSSNWREKILDKDNHAMDDCKYFINSHPKERKHTQPVRRSDVKMYKWYM